MTNFSPNAAGRIPAVILIHLRPTVREDGTTVFIHDPDADPTDLVPFVAGDRDLRQAAAASWCQAAFGADHASSLEQRAVRMLEEAIEAYQAAGATEEMGHRLLTHVFSRPVGKLSQELGGLGLTILAFAAAAKLSADVEEARELDRVRAKPLSEFHARNQAKNALGFNVLPSSASPALGHAVDGDERESV